MKDLLIIDQKTDLTDRIKLALFHLWNNEYPVNLSYPSVKEFEMYLSSLKEVKHTFLIDEHVKICGWYFDFIRDRERWFGLILDSSIHGRGYGVKMMNYAKSNNLELNGWVIERENLFTRSGKKYKSPMQFYATLGFEKIPIKRMLRSNLEARQINWRLLT